MSKKAVSITSPPAPRAAARAASAGSCIHATPPPPSWHVHTKLRYETCLHAMEALNLSKKAVDASILAVLWLLHNAA